MDSAAGPAVAPGGRGGIDCRVRVIGLVLLVNLAGGLLLFLYFAVIDVSSLSRMRFIRSSKASTSTMSFMG